MFVLVASLGASPNGHAAQLALGVAEAAAGATLLLPVSYIGPELHPPVALVAHLAYPVAAMEILEVAPAKTLVDAGKSLDYEIGHGMVSVALFGGDAPIPDGVIFRMLARVDADAPPTPLKIQDAGTHGADAEAAYRIVAVDGGEVLVLEALTPHSADTTGDWRIDLPELLRVIQLYNTGAYHCDADGEDGFAPGEGPRDCSPHDADYAPVDWRISFTELLRIIQLYNAPHGAYHRAADTEDGFAPGPFGYDHSRNQAANTP